jgi:hypothetical protein
LIVQVHDVLLETLEIMPLLVMRRYAVPSNNAGGCERTKKSTETSGSLRIGGFETEAVRDGTVV